MPRPKSFLPRLDITEAGRAHDCQHNPRHRLSKGDPRLSLQDGRSTEHFCVECARAILKADIARLQTLLASLED